ncbi:hypothetical protein [Streptomyces europaeiscabiei]|uniref:hypothetical protein n=1 Tax=Streptomyces europaeiscabiei TaxID=146819 RepID=UPI0013C4AEE9|nr:hypothetical protein [Streptomyces europaeiscabiei]
MRARRGGRRRTTDGREQRDACEGTVALGVAGAQAQQYAPEGENGSVAGTQSDGALREP